MNLKASHQSKSCFAHPARVLCGLMGLSLLGLSGCSTTQAHDRGRLAKPVMSLDPEADRFALRRHVLSTREGAVGGFGGGGGGCGCN